MAGRALQITAGAGLVVGLAAASYPLLWRDKCLSWGATPAEVTACLPGDELLSNATVVSTRGVTIGAPPSCVWPWLVQMGSGRAGGYGYDWLENMFGLDMHSADVILPQFQEVREGDEFPLGRGRLTMRVAMIDPVRTLVLQFARGRWVRIFALRPADDGTRLVIRSRVAAECLPAPALAALVLTEPAVLIMERKMYHGIRARAERLASERQLVVA